VIKRHIVQYFAILALLMLVFSPDCYAGWRDKVTVEILEVLGRNLEKVLKYVGLGIVMIFLKSVSWTKMTFGGLLALLGALFPKNQEEKNDEGEAKISSGKISIALKGGARFAVVIAGLVLIVGAVYDGVKGADKEGNPANDYIESMKNMPQDRGWIGINYVMMDDKSVLITWVVKKSPADLSKLKVGDVIKKINNCSANQIAPQYITSAISGYPGTTVKLDVERKGEFFTVDVLRVTGKDLANLVEREITNNGNAVKY
jgi:hypothetical protein